MTTIEVLYEDNHLLVLNKPAGWLVQGDKTGDPTLTDWGKEYLKTKYEKPGAVFLHPAHRIDRPVSGAVLFARTDKALSRLTRLFHDKKVEKQYLARVTKPPKSPLGELTDWLLKDERTNTVRIVSPRQAAQLGAKESVTAYELFDAASNTLLVFPRTGRPHQIRVQLANMGCPVLGDLKYGAPAPLPDASIALHCHRMQLTHPVRNEPLHVEAPLPQVAWWK
jgi:23S rRNA pseudouridine1911/1915/1917 synthase